MHDIMDRKAIYTRENENILIYNGQEWNFHESDTQEHLHSLHPYPAKFIPQIPHKAIESWSLTGDIVYDPFCGCGTTLLEASLLGRDGIGTDNNAVAVLASKAKTAIYQRADLDTLRKFAQIVGSGLSKTPARPDLIPDNINFLYWFSPAILDRLAALKGLILEFDDPVRTMLLAVFSAIIVRVSYQDSDTRYAKIDREVKPDEVDKIYLARLRKVLESLPEIMTLGRGQVTVHLADARKVSFIESESISLIVTSPPYLNAYDYHKYHRQRIHWINGSVELARDLEIGSHDEFTRTNAKPDRYFSDMDACFLEWERVLKKGGRCLVVIGDAIVSKQPVYVGDMFVDLLEKHGLQMEERWIRTLHATKRAFNVRNSRITHEHVLLFIKKL
jgi:DNA modification methylase